MPYEIAFNAPKHTRVHSVCEYGCFGKLWFVWLKDLYLFILIADCFLLLSSFNVLMPLFFKFDTTVQLIVTLQNMPKQGSFA